MRLFMIFQAALLALSFLLRLTIVCFYKKYPRQISIDRPEDFFAIVWRLGFLSWALWVLLK